MILNRYSLGEKTLMETNVYVEASYSEWVLRNAASIAFTGLCFEVTQVHDGWCIKLESDDHDVISTKMFYGFLNDFRLREIIDEQTSDVRLAIVKKALELTYSNQRKARND